VIFILFNSNHDQKPKKELETEEEQQAKKHRQVIKPVLLLSLLPLSSPAAPNSARFGRDLLEFP
jgi:hypothetical protein